MAFRQLQMWLVGVCFCTQIAHAAPDFEFGNNPGPFPVGIRAVQQLDQTRVFKPTIDIQSGARTQGERARPLQMLVWYPAQSSGSPLRYGDYLRWNVTEDDFSLSQTELDRRHQTLKGQWAGATAPQHAVTAELQRPLWASHHAPLAHGKFPLVIYAASFGASATENIELCEYLASHGYVVIAVPSMGAHSHEMTADIAGAEAQVADIGLALAYAHQLPEVEQAIGAPKGGAAPEEFHPVTPKPEEARPETDKAAKG